MSELLDFGNAPEIYGDGIAEVQIIGGNARLLMFAWRKINGCFQRVLVATLIRPASSLGDAMAIKRTALEESPQIVPQIMSH